MRKYSSYLRARSPERGDKPEDFQKILEHLDSYAKGSGSEAFTKFVQMLQRIPNSRNLLYAYWHGTVIAELMKEFDKDGDEGEIGDLLGQALESFTTD
jgi:hypothetical protein